MVDGNTHVTLAFLVTLINLTLAIVTFINGRHKAHNEAIQDAKEQTVESVKESDAKELANKEFQIKTQMKLDQICTTTSETRTDIKAMESRLTDIDKRLYSAEGSIKTLGKRMHLVESKVLGVPVDDEDKNAD